ncbi:MAG TPA: hypothetical protein VJ694_04085 [Patescibacteria group bacterium]|nr:hypothetical protein [Patescibacteria group bacterium]
MKGSIERRGPSAERETRRGPERETGVDVFGERSRAFKAELAMAKAETEEATTAVHEARLRASRQEGHLSREEQEELTAMEDEADAIQGRYESLRKKASAGGILDAIAEDVVTTAVIEHAIPIAPVAKVIETVTPIAKIAAEDELTPAQRRKREREKPKDGG